MAAALPQKHRPDNRFAPVDLRTKRGDPSCLMWTCSVFKNRSARRLIACFFLVLAALLLFAPCPTMADGARNSRFYDFSETVFSSEQKLPGITLILGESFGRSQCQEDDFDAFRQCLGEVKDVFRFVPRGQPPRVDVVFVLHGIRSAGMFADATVPLVNALNQTPVDARALVLPAIVDKDTGNPKPPTWTSPKQGSWQLPISAMASAALDGASKGFATSGISALRELGVGRWPQQAPRPGALVAVVLIMTEDIVETEGTAAVRALDTAYGRSGWTLSLICDTWTCNSSESLVKRALSPPVAFASRNLHTAITAAVTESLEIHRPWLLSSNPALSGHLELWVGESRLDPSQYSYDPFERRIRVADSRTSLTQGTEVTAWYFPFDPRQAVLQFCPAAVESLKSGQPANLATLPCRGFCADELVGLSPQKQIDIRFTENPPWALTADQPDKMGLLKAFSDTFQQRGVSAVASFDSKPIQFRPNSFRVRLTTRKSTVAEPGIDALIVWDGTWSVDAMERLAWRTMNRTIGVKISGMPIVYDSLRVFLNGRSIDRTTQDGAGYLMKSGSLFLDVAAPIHPNSHLFLYYRRDRR